VLKNEARIKLIVEKHEVCSFNIFACLDIQQNIQVAMKIEKETGHRS